MLIGRVVWGIVSFVVYRALMDSSFALAAFWTGGFVNAWPGIVLQLIIVPLVVKALERARMIPAAEKL